MPAASCCACRGYPCREEIFRLARLSEMEDAAAPRIVREPDLMEARYS